jgi:hypothetical protein
MPGFKYGLLVLASREGLSAPVRMSDSTELVAATLDSFTCGSAPTPRELRWQGLLLRTSAGPCDSHAPEVVMVDGPMSPNEFGEAFKDFMRQVSAQGPERS